MNANYYCTWNTQNFGRTDAQYEKSADVFLGAEGAKKARNFLDEEHIFQEGGLADQYEEIRKDLYFLLDDGWDVPYNVNPDINIAAFGSLLLAEDRFPSFTGTPAQRLKKINQAFQDKGWKGVGLWIASQAAGESSVLGGWSMEESRKYWRERMEWCKEAGIEYWKIDWGYHLIDAKWRNMLNELRDEIMPTLHIEQCYPTDPTNYVEFLDGEQVSSGNLSVDWAYPEAWYEILEQAEIFRTYDVLPQFSQVSTVERVVSAMKQCPDSKAVINCEDEVYLGAVLGCNLGIMRSGLCKEIPVYRFDPQNYSRRLDEVVRAVNWQKLAPAFPIRDGKIVASDFMERETYYFQSGEIWKEEYIGKEIYQECPGIIARNMELPELYYYEDRRPIVAVATHPNGAISAVSLPRGDGRGNYETPKTGIVLKDIQCGKPIGIFGHWEKITFVGTEAFAGREIWVEDLKDGAGIDITMQVSVVGNRVEIDSDVLQQLAQSMKTDLSEPGMLFYIR